MDEKLNQWIAFIDNYDRGLIKMAEEKNQTLKKARVEMNYLTGDEEVRRLAELREKWEMDYKSAQKAEREEGLKIGKEEGKKQGIREGKKEGKKQGSKEEKQKIAQKMLMKKLPLDLIQEITQLTQEELEELLKKQK